MIFLESPEDLKYRVSFLNKLYQKQGKWIYKVDETTGEIKLRASVASDLLGYKPAAIKNILAFRKPKQKQSELAILVANKLNEQGREIKLIESWLEEGISLTDFEMLVNLPNDRKQAIVFKRFYKEVGKVKFLQLFFEALNPSYKTELKEISVPQLPKIEKPKRQKATSIKRIKKAVKRYRPAYDATPNDLKELAISRRLAASLNAVREYPTPSGNIDLVTSDSLIEVKSGDCWKHGIGQLIAYGSHLPGKKLVLYLFDYDGLDLDNAKWVCSRVNIEVRLEP